jgi:DNA polymerase I
VIDLDVKQAMQQEAQTRTTWPIDLRAKLLSYCDSDVTATAQLLLAVLPEMLRLYGGNPEGGLYGTLMRGECAAALGKAELRGLPVNADDWATLHRGRLKIFPAMVAGLEPGLRAIYRDTGQGPVFSHEAFEAEMMARGLAVEWPRTPLSGRLSTSHKVLDQMLRPIPALHPLAEVMGAQSTVALLQWNVGKDGRCRTLLSPGRTATGRCAPKGREFLFAAPRRFRHALQAPPGMVLLQADYSGQEAGILGEQAGDLAYMAAYRSADIHLATAKMCGLVPESATGDTHPRERAQLKAVNLGLAYGARPPRIAAQLGVDLAMAEHLYRTHRRVFGRTHDYLASVVDTADTDRGTATQDGWWKRIVAPFRTTSALNYGVQATGAAILRRAIVFAERAGLPLVATVHDSLVFCCPVADAPAVLLEAERVMVAAAAYFCPGVVLRVDFAASLPVSGLPGRTVKPIAEARSREGYDRVLEQARQGAAAA